jgi:peptidoglycan/xylan/chitin deacetylase (PgdA/CDA1 family)
VERYWQQFNASSNGDFMTRALAAALALLVFASPSSAQVARPHSRTIAITIDDVPWSRGNESPAARLAATAQMISALRAHHAPVTVFVVCGRLRAKDPILAQWLAAGATIGNHTAHHRDWNTTSPAEWLADVRSCDATLRSVTHQPVRYFRFPMLHEGQTAARVQAAQSLLRELHYQNGHVSIDNSDFLAAEPYSAASARGDTSEASRIARVALAHDLAATRHFEDVARRKVGRNVAHVILLHANAKSAALIGPLLDALERRGYSFATLDAALADSVYQQPSNYVGPQGLSFLYRIAPYAARDTRWDDSAAKQLRESLRR